MNIDDYRINKPATIEYVKKNGILDISFYAAVSFIPLFAIWTFIEEEFPEYIEEAKSRKKILTEFYGYEEENDV